MAGQAAVGEWTSTSCNFLPEQQAHLLCTLGDVVRGSCLDSLWPRLSSWLLQDALKQIYGCDANLFVTSKLTKVQLVICLTRFLANYVAFQLVSLPCVVNSAAWRSLAVGALKCEFRQPLPTQRVPELLQEMQLEWQRQGKPAMSIPSPEEAAQAGRGFPAFQLLICRQAIITSGTLRQKKTTSKRHQSGTKAAPKQHQRKSAIKTTSKRHLNGIKTAPAQSSIF